MDSGEKKSEVGGAMRHAVSVIACENCRTLVSNVKIKHTIGTGRSPGISVGCKCLQASGILHFS